MKKSTSTINIALIWATLTVLTGCVQSPKITDAEIESQKKKMESQHTLVNSLKKHVDSQYKKIAGLLAKLNKSMRENENLEKKNKIIQVEKSGLINTNSELIKVNDELALKIDMLKTLDNQVEEKRQTHISE